MKHRLAKAAEQETQQLGGRPREPREIAALVFNWRVAQVRTGCEFVVADALEAAGFCGYAPMAVKICLQGKHGAKRKPVDRVRAAFPGYVFVGLPVGLFVTRRAHEAVVAILDASVAPWAVAAVNRLELAGEWNEREKLRRLRGAAFRVGESVAVDLGDGVTREGLVVELRRAGLRVQLAGATVPLTLPVDRVQRFAV